MIVAFTQQCYSIPSEKNDNADHSGLENGRMQDLKANRARMRKINESQWGWRTVESGSLESRFAKSERLLRSSPNRSSGLGLDHKSTRLSAPQTITTCIFRLREHGLSNKQTNKLPQTGPSPTPSLGRKADRLEKVKDKITKCSRARNGSRLVLQSSTKRWDTMTSVGYYTVRE